MSEVEPVLCFCCLELAVDAGGVILEIAGEVEPASTELIIGAGDTDRWLESLSAILTAERVNPLESQGKYLCP